MDNKYIIDTSQLQVGQVFKNTKSLCEYISQQYITGSKTSRDSQLKEWKRYIDWEKDGQKIIITDIYPTPLEKSDGRVLNGTQLYQKFIEDILLAYMDSQMTKFKKCGSEYFTFTFTLNQLILLCGMVNDKYVDKNITQSLLDIGYSKFNIKDFFARTQSKFCLVINNALNSMQKRKLISYEKKYIIAENGIKRVANYKDESDILDIEKRVLIDMGYESVIEVYVHNKTKEYYSMVNKYANEKLGWDYCYRSYILISNNNVIELEKQYLANTNQQNKLELNKRLTKFFNNQINQKKIKNDNNDLNTFKLPDDYISQQNSLTDYLLNIENNPNL